MQFDRSQRSSPQLEDSIRVVFKFRIERHGGVVSVFLPIRRLEELRADGRAHPCRAAWLQSWKAFAPHPIQLSCCPKTGPHELHFIDDPLAVLVQEAEMHGPIETAHAIASIQCPRQKHVLRPNEHPGPIRCGSPGVIGVTANELVDRNVNQFLYSCKIAPQSPGRLVDETTHRQAVNQVKRLVFSGQLSPRPRKCHTFCFPHTRGNRQQVDCRLHCQFDLPIVWGKSGGRGEKISESLRFT